jgi:hypothetical protein
MSYVLCTCSNVFQLKAYGWEKRQEGDIEISKLMTLVSQEDAYTSCGLNMKKELIDGSAIVMFAYGLSGSGKTYTVFGNDDPKNGLGWFMNKEPQKEWGILPRLAYELYKVKEQSWKFHMKYFQNVVDIVRDLMSPTAEERSYKAGIRKDKDGFNDITWCSSALLQSWDEFRRAFARANRMKAIAPTQFNHLPADYLLLTLIRRFSRNGSSETFRMIIESNTKYKKKDR